MTGEPKFNFEQISVETVRKIATDLPAESAPASREPGHLGESSSPGKRWQELALQMQQERDPKKMLHLVNQLIVTLDQNRRGNHQVSSAEQKPAPATHQRHNHGGAGRQQAQTRIAHKLG
jgi:hypothetical protein